MGLRSFDLHYQRKKIVVQGYNGDYSSYAFTLFTFLSHKIFLLATFFTLLLEGVASHFFSCQVQPEGLVGGGAEREGRREGA